MKISYAFDNGLLFSIEKKKKISYSFVRMEALWLSSFFLVFCFSFFLLMKTSLFFRFYEFSSSIPFLTLINQNKYNIWKHVENKIKLKPWRVRYKGFWFMYDYISYQISAHSWPILFLSLFFFPHWFLHVRKIRNVRK